MSVYKSLIRPAFFRRDPEAVHESVLHWGSLCARTPFLRQLLQGPCSFTADSLTTTVSGLSFSNPIGLAAGFDKNCSAVELFQALGFGFIELGTITAQPQSGNPKPRIFRFEKDQALINRMGFPSEGAAVVADRLRRLREGGTVKVPLGVNIGKTKIVPVENARDDYEETFRHFAKLGDYFVLNVSSPNTPELRKLQERSRLEELIRGIQSLNTENRPLWIKVAPDLTLEELDQILDCCVHCGVAGIIATNTTVGREGLSEPTTETGGLSGQPLAKKSLNMVSHIARTTGGSLPIIAVGGISSIEQLLRMFHAGASLVQIYTALIYEGPGLVCQLKRALADFLAFHQIPSINYLKDVQPTEIKPLLKASSSSLV